MAKECSDESCTRASCEGCPSRPGAPSAGFRAKMNAHSNIRHVVGVISGKGGVGKSTVTAEMALALRRQGRSVGILDGDLTGPSIPRMFGVHDALAASETEIYPAVSQTGIRIMSVNLVLEDESQAVIWRGPILGGVIRQFWSDVIWGDLDYLLVDMPPGTGDIALTLFQSLPLDGVFLVTSPQGLVEMIVKKAYNMAEIMKIPVLGVIENFSCLICPDCGRKILLFGRSGIEAWAAGKGIPFVGSLEMDPELPSYADSGRIEFYPKERLNQISDYLPKEN